MRETPDTNPSSDKGVYMSYQELYEAVSRERNRLAESELILRLTIAKLQGEITALRGVTEPPAIITSSSAPYDEKH